MLWFRGRQRKKEDELERELRNHVYLETEEQRERGVPAEEARYAALRAFGNVTRVKEIVREMWGPAALAGLGQDIRYSLRSLRNNASFTTVAILTLALGIGATTTIFTVVNAVLLRPLPFSEPDQLVQLWETEPSPGNFPLIGQDYLEWQANSRSFAQTSIYSFARFYSASGGSEAQPVTAINTEANFFSLLRAQPLLGRTFAAGEDQEGKNHVAVISYRFWQSFFGGQEDVVNKTVELNREPYTVVGVMPEWFNFPASTSLYVPIDMGEIKKSSGHTYRAIGRLRPESTVEQAQAELSTIAKGIAERDPDSHYKIGAVVVPEKEYLTSYFREQCLILFGAVGLVLLVACANVANLLLARATGRRREVAVRSVLGAQRWRIVRQLLTESVLLSVAGAALGTIAAWWLVRVLRTVRLPIPKANPLQVDTTVLLFAAGLSVLVGILFGLAPALQASKPDIGEELKSLAQTVLSASGWQRRLRDMLVVSEIAVSLTLLAGAGLLMRTFIKLRNADIGAETRGIITMRVGLPRSVYSNDARRQFADQVVERLDHLPGVEASAMANMIPLEAGSNGFVKVIGKDNPAFDKLLVGSSYITPEYFRVFGIPLQQGRLLSPQDMDQVTEVRQKIKELKAKDPKLNTLPADILFVAVINRAMARTFWPDENPLGKTFKFGGSIPFQVVGVVGDVKQWGPGRPAMPEAYYPLQILLPWWDDSGISIAVKTSQPPAAVLGPVRNTIHDLDKTMALFDVRTMEEVVSDSMRLTNIQMYLFGSFAGLAVFLAAIGMYSVLAYLVTQRTREIGIRVALGAQRRNVLRLVVGHGAKLVLVGVILGVLAAWGVTRIIAGLLYGVSATDPLTFAGVVVVLTVVALVACLVPASRAMSVDPMVALRHE